MKMFLPVAPRFAAAIVAGFLTLVSTLVLRADEPAKPAALTAEQEAKFTAFLNNVTLKGSWRPIVDGQLGPEKQDAYNIASVTKLEGDKWQINALMSYGGKEIQVPVPARVQWAADAAVLIVDEVNFGTSHTYSARVMIGEKTYAGWWSGGGHGGVLSGVLAHKEN